MLRRRVSRVEGELHRREAAGRKAAALVAALRALLGQLREGDPFPGLAGGDYLRAFWPWLLARAGRWPAWAVDYAVALGGLPAATGRLARRGGPPAPQPLRGIGDIVRLLHEQVEAVRADGAATPLEQARVLGYLAGLARKAIETGELAARLEILEAVLKQRPKETQR
jgi:hypothetical protein